MNSHHRPTERTTRRRHRRARLTGHAGTADRGFTPIEMLIVVVVLGAVAVSGTLAVNGMRTEAADTECRTGFRYLEMAATRYLGDHDLTAIPATGDDADKYERTLVDAGYLRQHSVFHDLDADGVAMTQEEHTC